MTSQQEMVVSFLFSGDITCAFTGFSVHYQQPGTSMSPCTSYSQPQKEHQEGSLLDHLQYYCWKQGSNSGRCAPAFEQVLSCLSTVLCNSVFFLGNWDAHHLRGKSFVCTLAWFLFLLHCSFFPLIILRFLFCSRQLLMPTSFHPWFLYWQLLSLTSRKKQHGLYPMLHPVEHMNRSSRLCTDWRNL